MTYVAAADRYDAMPYRRCGRSGLQLPAVSLGLWHNFGDDRPLDDAARDPAPRVRPRHHALRPGQQLRPAVRLGREQLRPHLRRGLRGRTATSWSSRPRPATTCGPGPYGEWGSRKYLLASLDQSCSGWGSTTSTSSTRTASTRRRRSRRRWARSTPRSARARRSTSASRRTRPSARARPRGILRELGTPLLIHQPSLLDAQPLDRGRACSTCSARRASAASRSRRSRRAC